MSKKHDTDVAAKETLIAIAANPYLGDDRVPMWSEQDIADYKAKLNQEATESYILDAAKPKDPHGTDQHASGAKMDGGKIDPSLLLMFSRALMAVAEVGTFGARKYTRGGWQHVPDGIVRYTAASMRHQLAEPNEEYDPESDLLHAAHATWNALARLELILRSKETNNERIT